MGRKIIVICDQCNQELDESLGPVGWITLDSMNLRVHSDYANVEDYSTENKLFRCLDCMNTWMVENVPETATRSVPE